WRNPYTPMLCRRLLKQFNFSIFSNKMVCFICLEPIGADRIDLHCAEDAKHAFCARCILAWHSIKVNCPACRREPKLQTRTKVQKVSKPRAAHDPDAFIVDCICGVRLKHGCIEFKVCWKGHNECTWEELAAGAKVNDFLKRWKIDIRGYGGGVAF